MLSSPAPAAPAARPAGTPATGPSAAPDAPGALPARHLDGRPVAAPPSRRAPSRLVAGLLVPAACAVGLAAPSLASAKDPGDLKRYYGMFDRGAAKIPGHDTPWTPQGLTHWPEQNALVISYYDSTGKNNSRLAIVNRDTGARMKLVQLNTKGHVGGLAMTAGHLWVANGGKIVRYTKAALAGVGELGMLTSNGAKKVAASSYLTADGSSLWVGSFTKGASTPGVAYRHDVSAKGALSGAKQSISTPSQVQGMAFAGGKIVWSRSYGRDNRSRIDVAPAGNPTQPSRIIRAPNMSEGIVVVGDRLRVVYESASSTYADASYRVKTVHSGNLAAILGP